MIFVFVSYLVVLLFITIFTAKRSKSSSDFALGDKKISGISLALSERATGESAWLLLGLTGEAYLIGIQTIWIALGCILGIATIWFLMGNRLRKETEKSGALTVSGLLTKKFPGSEKLIGTLSASIVVFFFVFYIAAQFNGGGKILHDIFGIDSFWGIIIGSLIVTIYCMVGGFITVVATDVFQAILMIITLIVLPVLVLIFIVSKDIAIMETLKNAGEKYYSLTAGLTGSSAVLLILSGLSWAFGYTGQPQLLTRMMAIRNEKDVKTAKWVAIIWTLFAYSGALIIGIAGFILISKGYMAESTQKLMFDCEKILPVMVYTFVTPVIAGILLSGAISAMMSTASSELVVSSSTISEDIYSNFAKKKMTQKQYLNFNKILTLAVGIVALILALSVQDTVYGLVSYAWSGIGSSFGPAIVLLLFWKKLSRYGVIASLLTGTVSTIIWKTYFTASTGISERFTSYILALIMAILFSCIFPEKKSE